MTKLIQREKFKVESNSVKGQFYIVECLFGRVWSCDCVCGLMSGRECAHVRSIKNMKWLENLTGKSK